MPVLENFRAAFSPDPTDCPRVSEDGQACVDDDDDDDDDECNLEETSLIDCTGHPVMHRTPNTN